MVVGSAAARPSCQRRDINMWRRGRGVRRDGGGCHMDWGGKRGEGAGKLTLDISHLNAAAIVIHITVKAVGCGRRAECAT